MQIQHVSEHSCSSLRVFLSIPAHLAHLVVFFFSITIGKIDECFNVSMKIQKSMSVSIAAHLCVFFSILAHLAHLAQSFFLISNGINK